ncbi:hypothetical protein PSV08DRAFT_404907 [Bipolaris maydis]|uniref:uncharacterized protein n=1 Tax=Cochliobolus heterostrophus TaxID=5016 RepID=UPI0024DB876F|nr:hypothetical protein PSV08DRAFT_404907 [Bipolaris maydis]
MSRASLPIYQCLDRVVRSIPLYAVWLMRKAPPPCPPSRRTNTSDDSCTSLYHCKLRGEGLSKDVGGGLAIISTVVRIDADLSVVVVQCRIVWTKECQVQLKDSQTTRRLHMRLGITPHHKPFAFHHRLYLSLLFLARLLDPTVVGMAQSPSPVLETMSPEFGPGHAIHVTIFPAIIRFANQLAKSTICMQRNPSNTRRPRLRQASHVSMTNPYKKVARGGKNSILSYI